MERKTKIPVTRVNLWYDDMDFDTDMDIVDDFLTTDANFRVVLFRVDRVNTNYDDVYGESDTNEVRFLPPVELVVSALKIEPAEPKEYGQGAGSITYTDRGPLSFAVTTSSLDNKSLDIRRGDFIGYAYSESGLQYWTVRDDGRMNMDNAHTLYGTRPFFRSIKCLPVDPNQFNAL